MGIEKLRNFALNIEQGRRRKDVALLPIEVRLYAPFPALQLCP